MIEKRPNGVVYPLGEGNFALPEEVLDTFFMEVNAVYESVLRALHMARDPAELPKPIRDEERPDQT